MQKNTFSNSVLHSYDFLACFLTDTCRVIGVRHHKKEVLTMSIKLTLLRIEGDYAILLSEAQEEITVALALLPKGAGVGSHLEYDFMDFRLID